MINVCTCELYERDNELIVFLNDAILDLFGFLPSLGSRWPQSVSLNKWTFNGCLSASQVEKEKHSSREGRKKLIKLAIHLGYRCCKMAIEKGKLLQFPCQTHFMQCSKRGGHRIHNWGECCILGFSENKSQERLV